MPEQNFTYRYLLPEMAKAGYGAVAVLMRGFTLRW